MHKMHHERIVTLLNDMFIFRTIVNLSNMLIHNNSFTLYIPRFHIDALNIALLFVLHLTGMLYQITLYKHTPYNCPVIAYILLIAIHFAKIEP